MKSYNNMTNMLLLGRPVVCHDKSIPYIAILNSVPGAPTGMFALFMTNL